MIEIGSLDKITSLIGERGTGKSTLAIYDARNFQATTGGFVVGHSPRGQIGHWPDVTFHDSLRALERGVRRSPERIHILTTGSPEPVIQYAIDLSETLKRRAIIDAGHRYSPNRPPPRGTFAAPVLAIVDEGIQAGRGAKKEQQEWLEDVLTNARHSNLGLTWLTQAPTARSWTVQEQASEFRVFRYLHEWGLNAVRAAAIPHEYLAEIRKLPKFHYFHFDKAAPHEARFRVLASPL